MNLLPIILTIAVASSTATTENQSKSAAFLEAAMSLKKEETRKSPRGISVLMNLRKAWLACDTEGAKVEQFEKIRKELVAQYKRLNSAALADWYATAKPDEITKKMREKENESKTMFQKDWMIRMDEFDMITVWKPESLKANPVFYHYKPGDNAYGEVLAMAKLKRGTEKPVDFDLSSLFIANGPSFSITESLW
ncbi:MAG TPA: hypothetical protein EYN91_24330 [Candidatus Melainabacteria bacterium]|nr:hypothetical protein [Candidatus Melainabacteria bacterium]